MLSELVWYRQTSVLGEGRVIVEAVEFSQARIDPDESHKHHGMVSAPVLSVEVPPATSTLRHFSTARRKTFNAMRLQLKRSLPSIQPAR
jgi:hypothetical protein